MGADLNAVADGARTDLARADLARTDLARTDLASTDLAQPKCGNAKPDPGETCDPPSSCPAACSSPDPCKTAVLVGSASTCTAKCVDQPVTACKSGDGCCPPSCGCLTDSDCVIGCQLLASVSAGSTSTSNTAAALQNHLNPSATYSSAVAVAQDQGYFLRLLLAGQAAQALVEVSLRQSNGTWGPWLPFASNGGQVSTDANGIVPVDFVKFAEPATGLHEAKFRLKGLGPESNPISVTVMPAVTSKYLVYAPGDYWTYRGCASVIQDGLSSSFVCPSADAYGVRLDTEETQTIGITNSAVASAVGYHSIVANPVRVSLTPNTPVSWTGGVYDFTWFLSKGFDSFGGKQARWALKTVFYDRSATPRLQKNRYRTAIFFRTSTTWPAYFNIADPQDLKEDLAVPGLSFFTFMTYCSNFTEGSVSYAMTPCTNTSGNPNLMPPAGTDARTGWNTDYRMVSVDFPKFKGRALRIRYWEYDTDQGAIGSFLNATAWNFDEWFYAEAIGLVGINNKYGRGALCSADPDCSNASVKMGSPTFSVSLADSMLVSQQSSFVAGVSSAPGPIPGGASVTIARGSPYYLTLQGSSGRPYTGFIEVVGTAPGGAIARQVFRDITSAPVWVQDGVGLVQTGATQAAGSYSVSIRPLILSDTQPMGANTRPWSNQVTVVCQ